MEVHKTQLLDASSAASNRVRMMALLVKQPKVLIVGVAAAGATTENHIYDRCSRIGGKVLCLWQLGSMYQ